MRKSKHIVKRQYVLNITTDFFELIMLFLVSYAQIDWHDFVVVETVDFQSNESGNFPPPTTPEEVGARLLAQERYEAQRASQAAAAEAKREERAAVAVGANTQVEDMEEDSDDEDAPKKAAKKAMPQVRAAPAVQAPTPVEKPRPPPVAQQPQQVSPRLISLNDLYNICR